jgi:hypothetical protein
VLGGYDAPQAPDSDVVDPSDTAAGESEAPVETQPSLSGACGASYPPSTKRCRVAGSGSGSASSPPVAVLLADCASAAFAPSVASADRLAVLSAPSALAPAVMAAVSPRMVSCWPG